MNALQKFLIENDVRDTKETFRLDSPRLKTFDFTVSGITTQQYQQYQTASVTGAGKKREFKVSKFNMLVILNHCVEPSFKDAEFMKACGVATPEDCVNRSLRAGEVQQLSEKILALSGFNMGAEVEEEDVEEVKNS